VQPDVLAPSDSFARRHIGPQKDETAQMLAVLGYKSLDELAAATVPAAIRLKQPLRLGPPLGEHELIEAMKNLAADNTVMRSFIGQGYYDTITPPVILRNVLENPGWYTQYTPYQAEISQGRLEALINFQTMIEDLTGLPMAPITGGTYTGTAAGWAKSALPEGGVAFIVELGPTLSTDEAAVHASAVLTLATEFPTI